MKPIIDSGEYCGGGDGAVICSSGRCPQIDLPVRTVGLEFCILFSVRFFASTKQDVFDHFTLQWKMRDIAQGGVRAKYPTQLANSNFDPQGLGAGTFFLILHVLSRILEQLFISEKGSQCFCFRTFSEMRFPIQCTLLGAPLQLLQIRQWSSRVYCLPPVNILTIVTSDCTFLENSVEAAVAAGGAVAAFSAVTMNRNVLKRNTVVSVSHSSDSR